MMATCGSSAWTFGADGCEWRCGPIQRSLDRAHGPRAEADGRARKGTDECCVTLVFALSCLSDAGRREYRGANSQLLDKLSSLHVALQE